MAEQTSLGELVARGVLYLSDGYRTRAPELGPEGIPILRVAEVMDGYLEPGFKDHVRHEFRGKIGRKSSQPGDVVITTKGTVGRAAMIPVVSPEFVYSPQVCFLRVLDEEVIDRRWLYSWIRSPQFQRQARMVAGQTDMAPYVNLVDLRQMRINLPTVGEQRARAEVLGALDDKIEANGRLVPLLRDAARAMLKGAAGEGIHIVGGVASVERGLSYSGKGLTESGMPMVNLANAGNGGWLKRSGMKFYAGPHKSRHIAAPGALLVSGVDLTWRLRIIGWPMLLPEDVGPALFSHHVLLVRFHLESEWLRLPLWAQLFTREARARLEGMVYGTTVATLPAEALTGLEFTAPPPDHPVLPAAAEMLRRAWAAERESAALAQLHDALLGPLMDGEIGLADAELAAAAAV